MNIELSPCPNCGSDRITLIDRAYKPRGFPEIPDEREYFYQCDVCGYETAPAVSGFHGLTGRTVTEDHARAVALERWQRQETRAAIRKRLFKDYPNQEEHEAERAALIREGRMQPWD